MSPKEKLIALVGPVRAAKLLEKIKNAEDLSSVDKLAIDPELEKLMASFSKEETKILENLKIENNKVTYVDKPELH